MGSRRTVGFEMTREKQNLSEGYRNLQAEIAVVALFEVPSLYSYATSRGRARVTQSI
jgi:hypothetical protein